MNQRNLTQTEYANLEDNLHSAIVEKLRMEAKNSPVFRSIAEVFTKRERTRGQITAAALAIKMTQTDRNISVQQCQEALAFLGRINCGRPYFDAKGEFKSLKLIKFTLQSIGMAALGETTKLDPFMTRIPYVNKKAVAAKPTVVPKPNEPTKIQVMLSDKATVGVSLQVTVDGKDMVFDLPHKIAPKELGALLARFFSF